MAKTQSRSQVYTDAVNVIDHGVSDHGVSDNQAQGDVQQSIIPVVMKETQELIELYNKLMKVN